MGESSKGVVFFFTEGDLDYTRFDNVLFLKIKKRKPHALWNLIFDNA
jgi:hypothetical protein